MQILSIMYYNGLELLRNSLYPIVTLYRQGFVNLTCNQTWNQSIQESSNHAAESKSNHAIQRIRAGAGIKVAERVKKEKHQAQYSKTNMPVKRRMQLTNNFLLMRTTFYGIANCSQEQEERANDGVRITGDAIGRNVIAMLDVPYKKNYTKRNTQEYK
jgi:hypothetical protein